MISENKITEIFCLADDFCKYFHPNSNHHPNSLSQQGIQRIIQSL